MNTYDRITDRIIELLNQGTVPWHKTWKSSTGLPRNLTTDRPYRGINVFLLMSMSYESPHWLTFRQAIQLGGGVKKGEKSCPIVFWKQTTVKDKESDESQKIPLLRIYHVFNVAQCDGVQDKPVQTATFTATQPEGIVAHMPKPPAIKHGMTKAFYSPVDDCVGMPEHGRFENEDSYHATLFHELVHATGHFSRLNRPNVAEHNGFGSDPYCKEELVAELGSAFLCGHSKIDGQTIDNAAAYINGWLKQLQNDRMLIVQAAAQAQKAADFILGTGPEDSVVNATEKNTPMVAEVCT